MNLQKEWKLKIRLSFNFVVGNTTVAFSYVQIDFKKTS